MEYRQLGDSGLSVSSITFGAWAIGGWMWGGAERKDALAAIRASYEHGVTSIDTAPVYGQGLSRGGTAALIQRGDRGDRPAAGGIEAGLG